MTRDQGENFFERYKQSTGRYVEIPAPEISKQTVYASYEVLDKIDSLAWQNAKWLGRKVFAIPKALWNALIKNILNLALMLILIPYVVIIQEDLKSFVLADLITISRNIRIAGACLLGIFHDRLGRYYGDKAEFEKFEDFSFGKISNILEVHARTIFTHPNSFDNIYQYDNGFALKLIRAHLRQTLNEKQSIFEQVDAIESDWLTLKEVKTFLYQRNMNNYKTQENNTESARKCNREKNPS